MGITCGTTKSKAWTYLADATDTAGATAYTAGGQRAEQAQQRPQQA